MPSLRSKLVNRWLRRKMKAQPLHRMDPVKLREGMEAGAMPFLEPRGVTAEIETAPVAGEWHRPADDDGHLIYYLHGGGYVFGSPKLYRVLTFSLAKKARASVFSLKYRLAPEHPFPAALDDAVAGYRWLLDSGRDPASIAVAGDSAGGGLALALMTACKKEGLPQPACAVLYSPWTDLTVSGATIDKNEDTDVMFKAEHIRGSAHRYVGDADPANPLISPLFADLEGIAPLQIFASQSEMLLDDSLRLHERAVAAGVSAELHTEQGLAHVWPIFTPLFPEAKKAVAQSVAFMKSHLSERAA